MYIYICIHIYIYPYMHHHNRWLLKHILSSLLVQGGEDPYDALNYRSFFAKEPLILRLFCGKWPVTISHSMTLCHPVGHHYSYTIIHTHIYTQFYVYINLNLLLPSHQWGCSGQWGTHWRSKMIRYSLPKESNAHPRPRTTLKLLLLCSQVVPEPTHKYVLHIHTFMYI